MPQFWQWSLQRAAAKLANSRLQTAQSKSWCALRLCLFGGAKRWSIACIAIAGRNASCCVLISNVGNAQAFTEFVDAHPIEFGFTGGPRHIAAGLLQQFSDIALLKLLYQSGF